MALVKYAGGECKKDIRFLSHQLFPAMAQLGTQLFICLEDGSVIGGRKIKAGGFIQCGFHQSWVARYSLISSMVSSGSLICGQWPVAFITRSVLLGSSRAR